jgi:hypothetical protein
MEARCSSETLTFDGLNGVICEKMEIFEIIIFRFQILESQIATVCSNLKIRKREICGRARTENTVFWDVAQCSLGDRNKIGNSTLQLVRR